MYQCTKCKHTVEYTTNYCPICGAETVQVEYVVVSAPQAPTSAPEPQVICQPEPTPAPQPNYYYAQPVQAPQQKKPHIAKKIVGMALSIEGFLLAVVYFFYVVFFEAFDPGMGAVMAFFGMMLTFPMSIVGLAMSNSCRNAGDTSKMTQVGKVLGIIGIGIAALYLVIGCAGDISYVFDGFYY